MYLKDEPCPECGVEVLTDTGHGPLKRTTGAYGVGGTHPVRNVCTSCRFGEFVDEMFVRKYGAGKKHLDAAGIPVLGSQDFFAVWIEDKEWALSLTFMDAISRLEAAEYDPHTAFSALVIRAADQEDAEAAVEHKDFDEAWRVTVPVDSQRRPLELWVEGIRWNATDRSALESAQLDRRRQGEAEIDRELGQLRQQRLAAL
jgi:hypothetical protein